MYKRYFLIKKGEPATEYVFIYRWHKRGASIYSGEQGKKGTFTKITSVELKPIDESLQHFLKEKYEDGFINYENNLTQTKFNFTKMLLPETEEESNEVIADKLWDVMEDLNDELFEKGLATNEGFVWIEGHTLVMSLCLFEKKGALSIIKKHLEKYCQTKGVETSNDMEKQLLNEQALVEVIA